MPEEIGRNRKRILLLVSEWLSDIMPKTRAFKYLMGGTVHIGSLQMRRQVGKAILALREGLDLRQEAMETDEYSRSSIGNAELGMSGARKVSDRLLKSMFTDLGKMWVSKGTIPTTPATEVLETYYSSTNSRRPEEPVRQLSVAQKASLKKREKQHQTAMIDLFGTIDTAVESEKKEPTPEDIILSVDKTLPEKRISVNREPGAFAIIKDGVRIERPSQQVTLRVAAAMMGLKSL